MAGVSPAWQRPHGAARRAGARDRLRQREDRSRGLSLLLTPDEIRDLTGGLTKPRCQVKRLHERGFVRARLERGKVILERTHYEAVCRNEFVLAPEKGDTPRPQLKSLKKAA